MPRRRRVAPRPARHARRPSPATPSEAERRLLALARELGGPGRDAPPGAPRALAIAYAPDAPLPRAVARAFLATRGGKTGAPAPAWARGQARLRPPARRLPPRRRRAPRRAADGRGRGHVARGTARRRAPPRVARRRARRRSRRSAARRRPSGRRRPARRRSAPPRRRTRPAEGTTSPSRRRGGRRAPSLAAAPRPPTRAVRGAGWAPARCVRHAGRATAR